MLVGEGDADRSLHTTLILPGGISGEKEKKFNAQPPKFQFPYIFHFHVTFMSFYVYFHVSFMCVPGVDLELGVSHCENSTSVSSAPILSI